MIEQHVTHPAAGTTASLDLVNLVARQMTAAEAPQDLRTRVLQHLDAPVRRPVARWVPVLATAVVVAAAAFGIAVSRSTPRIDPPVAPNAQSGATVPAAPPAGQTPSSADATPARRVARRPAAPVSAANLAWHERSIPALQAIDPLAIDPIQPLALSISQLTVKPLTTAPLDGTFGGDGRWR